MSQLVRNVLLYFVLPCGLAAQTDDRWRAEFEQPGRQVLLVGTFHFKDAGLDSYKPRFDVDVLSPERQVEVESVLDCLAAFEPTRIALEVRWTDADALNADYRSFVAGDFELSSNEIHQIGFRLAERLGHERVFAVDAPARYYEPWVDPDEYAVEHGQVEMLQSKWVPVYDRLYRHEDALKAERPILDTLIHLNGSARVAIGHGRYLIENFPVGEGEDYPGVDSKTAWYNRNLRIFANVQRISESPDERVLVLIGAGHLSILRHAIESSPEYRLTPIEDYLYPACGE